MSVTVRYEGKCDKCGSKNPKNFVKVYHDRGDGLVDGEEFWCFRCVQNTPIWQEITDW